MHHCYFHTDFMVVFSDKYKRYSLSIDGCVVLDTSKYIIASIEVYSFLTRELELVLALYISATNFSPVFRVPLVRPTISIPTLSELYSVISFDNKYVLLPFLPMLSPYYLIAKLYMN